MAGGEADETRASMRNADNENESPVREPAPVALLAGCGVIALLVITMYFSMVCCCLILAMLAVPVVGGIITAETWRVKILGSLVAIVVTVLLAWIFILNPLLDIPCLGSPNTIELTDVSFTSDNVNDSVFYEIEGYDTEGNLRTFDVDRGFGDAWDPNDHDATVTYLPHSETVLSIE